MHMLRRQRVVGLIVRKGIEEVEALQKTAADQIRRIAMYARLKRTWSEYAVLAYGTDHDQMPNSTNQDCAAYADRELAQLRLLCTEAEREEEYYSYVSRAATWP